MADILTTGVWLSTPTKRASFLTRLLRAQILSRQRRADRAVEQYLASRGLDKMSDHAERVFARVFRWGWLWSWFWSSSCAWLLSWVMSAGCGSRPGSFAGPCPDPRTNRSDPVRSLPCMGLFRDF
jgi:hypothetical protein